MQKLKFLKPALPLTVICVIIALLLALVNAVTKDRITQNVLEEKENAIKEIFADCNNFESSDSSFYEASVSDAGVVYDANSNVIGYYADVAPIGFKGEISLIVGLDVEGKVLNAFCLSANETPGVGTKATAPEYLGGFIGKTSAEAKEVDTLSGATISTKAVRLGITNAVKTVENIIGEGK